MILDNQKSGLSTNLLNTFLTMDEKQISAILSEVVHPETGQNIVASGIATTSTLENGKSIVNLAFPKARDPFAVKIKNRIEELLRERFGSRADDCTVIITEARPQQPKPQMRSAAEDIDKIIAIASGKGGVGKSTVTANLAVTLRNMGYNVGILDADIYGPSQPKPFGLEGYVPEAVQRDNVDYIIPADKAGIKIMSIGFFIGDSDALVWRGPMANNALKQMIHQTLWGKLDFLLIDLPPGTGDVHLSVISELKIDSAVIVSTPQQVAVADVLRGIVMFRADKIEIPVAGIIENMAWFTPAELPENRYYIFGHGGAKALAEREGVDFLGEIPIIQSIMDGSESGQPAVQVDPNVEKYYRDIAGKIVDKFR